MHIRRSVRPEMFVSVRIATARLTRSTGPPAVTLLSLAIAARLCDFIGLGGSGPLDRFAGPRTSTGMSTIESSLGWTSDHSSERFVGAQRRCREVVGGRVPESSDIQTHGGDELSQVLVAIGVPA